MESILKRTFHKLRLFNICGCCNLKLSLVFEYPKVLDQKGFDVIRETVIACCLIASNLFDNEPHRIEYYEYLSVDTSVIFCRTGIGLEGDWWVVVSQQRMVPS